MGKGNEVWDKSNSVFGLFVSPFHLFSAPAQLSDGHSEGKILGQCSLNFGSV